VNLSDEPKNTATPQSTYAIDIVAFVEAEEIPFSCFETPYYLAPLPDGERVYALLREALNRTKKIAIAHVVIQARRRLAALIPCGSLLMLNTLRKVDRIASLLDARHQRGSLTTEQLTEKELATAARLVDSMTQKWDITCGPDVSGIKRNAPWLRPINVRKNAEAPCEISSPAARRDPHEILRPAIRLGPERVVNEQVANDHGSNDRVEEDRAVTDTKRASGPSGPIYQAQRNTRPRVRVRRTYH
jgi:hypothetical protein